MSQTPRLVSEASLARLGAWASRKPRLALMGEFSSGKSTLLNLLIGAELLPTRVTATELPPVWFSHGEARAFWVDRHRRRHPLEFGSFDGVPRGALYVRVFTPAPVLERCDIIDTPGISDPNLDEESWRFPVGQANFVLWCTPSTQAWRETERSTWASLPERLRAQSLLVVTRADKLNMLDREKVSRRLARESAGLFSGQLFLASLDAVRGQANLTATGNATLWEASGGSELLARIDLSLSAVRSARTRLLRRYEVGEPVTRADARAAFALAEAARDEPSLRLVQVEPVRPRRVELPETRRTERPLPEPVDPLDEIRAGWRALRAADPEPETASVLRLTDPLPRQEPAQEAIPAPEPVAAMADTAPDLPDAPVPSEPAADEPAAPLPRAVRLWREIVARSPEMPSNGPILAMIDQLLCELSRDDGPSAGTRPGEAAIVARNQAA